MKKPLLFFVTLCLALPALRAQEARPGWFAQAVSFAKDKLSASGKIYDTTYVWKLDAPWSVALDADLIRTGMETHSDVSLQGSGEVPPTHMTGHLRNDRYRKFGGGLTYGSLQLIYTTEFGKQGGPRNKFTYIAFTPARFGVSLQYYTTRDFLDGTVSGGSYSSPVNFSSQYPGEMRNLVADAFYFFNPSQFSYSAITGRNRIQRRSAGSFLVRAAYSQGEFRYDLRDALVQESRDHIGRYRNGDFSLGAGYSYNWVPLHRAPAGQGVKGLRNLTVNATFVPALSVYNHLHSTVYDVSDPDHVTEGKTTREHTFGLPGVSIAARAGASFSWDRFILCAILTYNRSAFRGISSVNLDEQTRQRYETKTGGSFYGLTTRLQFNVRF